MHVKELPAQLHNCLLHPFCNPRLKALSQYLSTFLLGAKNLFVFKCIIKTSQLFTGAIHINSLSKFQEFIKIFTYDLYYDPISICEHFYCSKIFVRTILFLWHFSTQEKKKYFNKINVSLFHEYHFIQKLFISSYFFFKWSFLHLIIKTFLNQKHICSQIKLLLIRH